MSSALKFASDALDAGLAAYQTEVFGLLDGGTLEIRTGSPPTDTTDPDDGTLLVTFDLDDPAFSIVAGVATLSAITGQLAEAAGSAGHFRAKASDSTVILQGTAGNAGDSPDLVLSNKVLTTDSLVTITDLSHTLTAPA